MPLVRLYCSGVICCHKPSEGVCRTPDPMASFVEDMRVNHGRFDILMPQKILDGPDVVSVFEQVARKTVAKSVAVCRLADAGLAKDLAYQRCR